MRFSQPFLASDNTSKTVFIINTNCQAPSPKLITEAHQSFAYIGGIQSTFSHQNGRGVVFKKQETLGTPQSSTQAPNLFSLCAGSLKPHT